MSANDDFLKTIYTVKDKIWNILGILGEKSATYFVVSGGGDSGKGFAKFTLLLLPSLSKIYDFT